MKEGSTLAGRYQLTGLLGEGGMARVYQALDLHLGRKVALKVLRESVAQDPEALERFRREARSAAALEHPRIVRVYDYLETPEAAFLVMELVEGHTLRERIRRGGPMPTEEALEVACQILQALEHAHQHGVIHRDLSARNVMVDPCGGIRVSDFGIARALGDRTLTQSGEMVGSVQYIAPEQARGDPVGPAADLYAVGVLLYEMLTAELPFTAENPVQLALKHVNEPPTPPSRLRRDLEGPVEDAILRALAKNPEDRYASAREMRRTLEALGRRGQEALERTLVKTPLPAGESPPPDSEEDDKRERSRCGSGLSAVLLVLLLALTGYAAWRVYRPPMQAEVPRLVGLTLEEAQGVADRAGVRLRIQEHRADAVVPAGTVLEQLPRAGDRLPRGESVGVVVSSGPRLVEVPDLKGLTVSRAEEDLENLGLSARVRREEHPTVPVGRVLGQDPAAGARVTESTSVEVVVSAGTGKSHLPNLVGMTRPEAEKVLADLGMELVTRSFRWSASSPEETVLEQSPSAGALVARGTRVRVVLSRGRKGLRAPDLEGKTIQAAREMCRELGLRLVVEGAAAPDQQVVFQEPGPGEPVTGEEIRVRAEESVVVPDVRHLDQEAARSELEAMRLAVGKVVRIPMSGYPAGEVVQQDPRPGIEVRPGAAVDLYVSDPGAPEPPPGAEPTPLDEGRSPAPPWVPEEGTSGAVEVEPLRP